MALTKVNNDLQDALAAAQPTITSTGTLTGLTVTGEITANGGIALGDNDELTLGDSDEFKIKHHASGYTHLQNTVGTLYIDSDSVTFRDDDGSPSNMVISQTGIDVTGAVNSTGEIRITNPSATSQLYLYGASGQKANIILNEYGVRSWHVGAGTFTSGNFSISDGSTERMKIDASGRVTMPYQPSFLAFLTTGDVTSGAVLYNNINHNNGSHYTASNGRFTAPVAGYYYFSVSGICGILTGTEVNGEYRMFKNSTLIDRGHFNHDNRWENVSYSKVIPLAVGDYVNMAFLGNTGSPALYGSSVYTSFSGHLLS